MDRLSPPHSPLAFATPAFIGRRDFLRRCGMAGAAVIGAAALSGCEGGRDAGQLAPASVGFFADGTDFAD